MKLYDKFLMTLLIAIIIFATCLVVQVPRDSETVGEQSDKLLSKAVIIYLIKQFQGW